MLRFLAEPFLRFWVAKVSLGVHVREWILLFGNYTFLKFVKWFELVKNFQTKRNNKKDKYLQKHFVFKLFWISSFCSFENCESLICCILWGVLFFIFFSVSWPEHFHVASINAVYLPLLRDCQRKDPCVFFSVFFLEFCVIYITEHAERCLCISSALYIATWLLVLFRRR